ncbi:Phospholipase D1, partial [Oleoguttula sp. CCFEE 5521]
MAEALQSTASPLLESRAGNATPERRSVQFAREAAEVESAPPAATPLRHTTTWETDEDTEPGPSSVEPPRERQAGFLGRLRLRSHGSPSTSAFHARTPSNVTAVTPGTPNGALSPRSERSEPVYPVSNAGDHEVAEQADVEEDSSDEPQQSQTPRTTKRRKRTKRPQIDSVPSTPMGARFASFIREHHRTSSTARPDGVARAVTMADVAEEARRAGVSEDEGRDRKRKAWKRGLDGARGISYSTRRQQDGSETPGERRPPMNLRRLTGMENVSSPFRAMRGDRVNNTSVSAHRWKQVKAGLKMLGQKKRNERVTIDHQKSAQLMAELLAGAPAALVFASMFQRDEHDHRKIPVLLEQLKIRIPSSHSPVKDGKDGASEDRHVVFRIELEYGNGAAKMNWVIHRTLYEILSMHGKYKGQGQVDKLPFRLAKQPRFPKSAFPYARGFRGLWDALADEEDDEDENEIVEESGREGEATTPARPERPRRTRSSFVLSRRKSSIAGIGEHGKVGSQEDPRRDAYAERQRRKLEVYLQRMIRWLIFRPDSTRLCKFLELSALSIRLSAEGGFVGKQGFTKVASRQHREIKNKAVPVPQGIRDRQKSRWTLVRHSYIVIVDGPESLNPYDVFLVDSDFITGSQKKRLRDQSAGEMVKTAAETTSRKQHHYIRLFNSERKLKLVAHGERQWAQFNESIELMAQQSIWAKKQRFGSFAPVRNDVWCRWLVDGRDHMWQVSRAIDNAKDFVYIHDWWLSPEIYMRRPAAISQKWRLDRLLLRKAQEGVKIFVIVYRNIESAIPIDSEYTKWSLLDLHENITIQRSPNQFRQNQFFWAHHEKLVVVDNMMAFVGGVDLCFGRWDDPCHSLTDDKLTGFELEHDVPRDGQHCQIWPGKDYSNPRVQDFYALDRPYEEMYDRTKVPRMPWHDIAMQIVGQPARDVGRHFVQRWNYILRARVPSRPTPILIPPPEYEQGELDSLGMSGTCQVQILRSCSPWSMGTPNKTEHSIMNAYTALIEASDHFVYIENQFYISSCTVEGTVIHNKIGDAIVERAIRAHENGEDWKVCLIIPLMPGFQNSVDSQDGTSIRLSMQYQYRSISRGETSIFGRLRAHGINPARYIHFFSLRQWGKIGPKKCLTTEQLYIHAKCMVVDDRHVIIGSANINERSMLGSRDSEVASIVTDNKMIPSFMAGEPYMVGEFPHTLRMRLMREHLGIDVDAIYRREQMAQERAEQNADMEHIYREDFAKAGTHDGATDYFVPPLGPSPPMTPRSQGGDRMPSPNVLTQQNVRAIPSELAGKTEDLRGWVNKAHTGSAEVRSTDSKKENEKQKAATGLQHDLDVEGFGVDNEAELENADGPGLRDTFVDGDGKEVLYWKDAPDAKRIRKLEKSRPTREEEDDKDARQVVQPPWPVDRSDT